MAVYSEVQTKDVKKAAWTKWSYKILKLTLHLSLSLKV
jgi:hypothetical protein